MPSEAPESGEDLSLLRTHDEAVDELRSIIATRSDLVMPPPPDVRDELYELGKLLAHEKLLSGPQDVACFSCHVVGLGTDDDLALAVGTGGTGPLGADRQLGAGRGFVPRNAPALFNLHAMDAMFWDGRVSRDPVTGKVTTPAGDAITPEMEAVFEFGALSAQAMFPVTNRTEMRGEVGESELSDIPDDDLQGIWAAIMDRLGQIPTYVSMFEAAYPGTDFDDMTFAHAANAIAGYEVRAFYRADTPWDRFLAGDDQAMTTEQVEGAIIYFGNGNCGGCHGGPNLSNQRFFNTGLAQFGPGTGDGADGRDDFGREKVTGNVADRYRFRSTPLRNVELTAPYGHTGQLRDLNGFNVHYKHAEQALMDYDITAEVDDPAHHDDMVENREAIAATISGAVEAIDMTGDEPQLVTRFMLALTDESARDMCDEVPTSLPSGLTIDDPCVVD